MSASKAVPSDATAYNRNALRIAGFIALLIAIAFSRPLAAQSTAVESKPDQVDPAIIQNAISRLGDPVPSVRQNAKEELRNFGAAATKELEQAAKFKTTLDYETQIAAAKILEIIQEEIALAETGKFVRGETDKFVRGEASLLGWQAFEKFTGDTPESRSLFRDIYLKNRLELTNALRPIENNAVSYGLLRELFESPKLDQVCLGMFLLASQQTRQNAAANDAEGSFMHERPSELQLGHLLSSCIRQTSPLTNLRSNIGPVASLVRAVIETAPKEHPILGHKLSLIQQIKSPEIGPLLVKFAAPEKPTVIRALAIAHAIKIADAETFEKLQNYLEDDTVVGQFLVNNTAGAQEPTKDKLARQLVSEVQIRDIVLLGNVQLAGQAPSDFGFAAEAINAGGNKIDIKRAGFANDKDRKQALERYRSANKQ